MHFNNLTEIPMTTNKLTGKVALVTGGSRGIGAAIAKRLAADGAAVAITYGTNKDKAEAVAQSIEATGGKAFVIHGDALKPETMPEVVNQVVSKFGKLDIVVNNAGIFDGLGPIGETDEAGFQRTIDVNIKSVFTLTQAAIKHLSEGGRIVNISSVLGERAIMGGIAAYNMSKFAVLGLTRTWALELAARGITVNAVQPGLTDTDMAPKDMAESVPMKRYGKPEEIAAAVAFFASAEASFITGAQLRVDGGANA